MLQIIIPFYKNYEQLEKCKESIKASGESVQIFVHDNSEQNIGFTRAVNKGLMQCLETQSPYILIINQDCYLEPEAIGEMIKFMDENKEFGIVAPLQVDGDKVICGGGAQMWPNGFNFCGDLVDFIDPYTVSWVEAACWMVRKEMVKEIGILDKNMVMFCSDSDYCLRARMQNWMVGMVPAAKCFHERGCTGKNPPEHIAKQKQHDSTYYHAKWQTDQFFKLLDHKPKCAPRQVLGKSFMEDEDDS